MEYNFTEAAKNVMKISEQFAKELGHTYLGTEHILYGLVKEDKGIVSKVFKNANVAPDRIYKLIEEVIGKNDVQIIELKGYTPRLKKIIDMANLEAKKTGSDFISTEHLLVAIFNDKDELLLMVMLSVSFILAGIGIVFLVSSSIVWASYEKLLQEGDYSKEKKEKQPIVTAISAAYWLIITAIYLGYSLFTNNWGYSWVIWVVAGVLFPSIIVIINLFGRKKS